MALWALSSTSLMRALSCWALRTMVGFGFDHALGQPAHAFGGVGEGGLHARAQLFGVRGDASFDGFACGAYGFHSAGGGFVGAARGLIGKYAHVVERGLHLFLRLAGLLGHTQFDAFARGLQRDGGGFGQFGGACGGVQCGDAHVFERGVEIGAGCRRT